MVNLTLKGVKSVKQSDLLQSIYTTASYCNSFILKPFCWISKSKYFFTRKYLDRQELERDVLRVRVFYWKRGYREAEVDTAVVKRGSNQVGVTFFIKEGPPTVITRGCGGITPRGAPRSARVVIKAIIGQAARLALRSSRRAYPPAMSVVTSASTRGKARPPGYTR